MVNFMLYIFLTSKKSKIVNNFQCTVQCLLSHFNCVQLFAIPWTDSPGKDTGVGCHTLLQGIFLT